MTLLPTRQGMLSENHDHPNDQQASWGECIYDHFCGFFGEPLYIQKFELAPDLPSILVLAFGNVFGGCRAFCSMGLAHYRSLIGEVAEVFLAVNDGWEESPGILAAGIFAALQRQAVIRSGVAFRFREWHTRLQRFASQFGKPAIYITVLPLNLPPELGRIACGGETAQVYFAFYLSEGEYDYYVAHGPDKLEELLEAKEADVFDIHRASVV
ncbi:MAG: suppressor of fused domain protein [Anaerolineae bacterium]|nr:suppressor of fused domain protein [Candidatus Roseilinea sp.]MDW8451352.1 suppressor of fused domain protein [Anaerolineae bacterium]